MTSRVAVVTGSNKGIGYAVVRGLCKQFDGLVYVTARNADLGVQAVNQLKAELSESESQKLKFHQLDITDVKSITNLRDFLQKQHNGLDILVNNAGMAYKQSSTASFGEQAEVTLKTNYYGTKQVCEILFPLLRPHSRIVNVCSRVGQLTRGYGDSIKTKLTNPNLTVKELDDLVDQFVKLAKEGKHTNEGFPNSAYGMSKAAEIALSHIQHKQLSKDDRSDIVINWCCPGFVATDMSSHKGTKSVDEGADTLIYLAMLSNDIENPRGKFIAERNEVDWVGGKFDFLTGK